MPPRSVNVQPRSQTRTSRSSTDNLPLHRTLRNHSPSSAITRRQKNRSSSGTWNMLHNFWFCFFSVLITFLLSLKSLRCATIFMNNDEEKRAYLLTENVNENQLDYKKTKFLLKSSTVCPQNSVFFSFFLCKCTSIEIRKWDDLFVSNIFFHQKFFLKLIGW